MYTDEPYSRLNVKKESAGHLFLNKCNIIKQLFYIFAP